MSVHSSNPTTAQFLNLIQRQQRGRLKVYFGYAPGLGKTNEMLEEGRRLRRLGVDVVIGVVETYGRADVVALTDGLEQVPCRRIPLGDLVWQQMDLNAVLARRPTVVLVDQLSRTNAPDSRNANRCLDVEELLNAGIHVITTLNVQYLEKENGTGAHVPGVKVRGSVPEHVLRMADQIVNIDLPAETLHDRFLRGKLHPVGEENEELQRLFTLANLTRLRDLAQHTVAELADRRDHRQSEHQKSGQERFMVCLASKSPNADQLVRTCALFAGQLSASWYAVHIATPREDIPHARPGVPESFPSALNLAEQLGGVSVALPSSTLVGSIAAFVAEYGITHIFLGQTQRPWYQRFFGRSVLERLLRAIHGVNVTVVDNSASAGQRGVNDAEASGRLQRGRPAAVNRAADVRDRQPPGGQGQKDIVQEASEESFPASDAPCWTLGRERLG
jgi:two-component system, OmpR family, sensor histidine kinase KdpD